MPPPPPPPPPLPKPLGAGKPRNAPPPPPPPPSMATGVLPRRAPPPPPPARSAAALPPPPPVPKKIPKKIPQKTPRAAGGQPPPPPTLTTAASPLKHLPKTAPLLPDTPSTNGEITAPTFPSFTMDSAFDLQDITNVHRSHRDSVYTASGHGSDGTNTRSSFGMSKRGSVTFAPLPGENIATPWKKPLDPVKMTTAAVEDDEEGELFDVPDRLTCGPGAAAARLDLQRCTIRVHKQLVDKLKTNSMTAESDLNIVESNRRPTDELSRCQGELWLKSRIRMLGWKKRYGSIVDHAYFGPVLFLFKYDAKGNVALRHSMMIVLVDSDVRLGKDTTTKDKDYRCEFVLRTTKRKYTVAANHTMRRDFWLRNLKSIQKEANSSHT